MNGLLDGFVIDIRALFANALSKIPNDVVCQWVKFNEIGADGKYVRTDTTFARYLTAASGTLAPFAGVGAPSVPTFVSVCVSMRTARARGPASTGRLFIPRPSISTTAGGRMSSATTQEIATTYANFLTALGDEEGVDNTAIAPAVVSNVGEPGPQERIIGVRVGDVPDVQRRRKNSLVEAYSVATVSTG
jgi:hypothetical protein